MLTCGLVFVSAWLLSPEDPTPQTYAFPYVLDAFVGMIAGIFVGTLVKFTLKMEDLIGLSIRFTNERKTLRMIFENDETGREFLALNLQESQ